ncbi:hypothetical protein [Umezawaea beigongshangensis]|uniref:hypothetical protein n=1 Tax=Umezawaea beigongshangensis TaxID=2780383 RepID=UPI0018F1A5E4|nr:hypothetical protein [Umezawaea beigongshangensis]
MLKMTLCVVVECDRCQAAPDDSYVEDPHFTCESDALEHLATMDWKVAPDGTLLCGGCVARQVCLVHGHDPGVWRRCGCHGLLVEHTADETGACPAQARHCRRCGEAEHSTVTPRCQRGEHTLTGWKRCLCHPGISGHQVVRADGECVYEYAWCEHCEHRAINVRVPAASDGSGSGAGAGSAVA